MNEYEIGNHLEIYGFHGWPDVPEDDGKEDHNEAMDEEEEDD